MSFRENPSNPRRFVPQKPELMSWVFRYECVGNYRDVTTVETVKSRTSVNPEPRR